MKNKEKHGKNKEKEKKPTRNEKYGKAPQTSKGNQRNKNKENTLE